MYLADLIVWSRAGHTPVTGRAGLYCDVLVKVSIPVADPAEARAELKALMARTPHADYGHYGVPSYPNQNTRDGFMSIIHAR
jgi:hypothetical protein